jgi:hypothetical protein
VGEQHSKTLGDISVRPLVWHLQNLVSGGSAVITREQNRRVLVETCSDLAQHEVYTGHLFGDRIE